jgi:glycosyltransferase involved in cell wall biosynthesis
MNKNLTIIPAYNEEDSIVEVIREIKSNLFQVDILVIDDGSNDATAQLAEKEADFCIRLPYHLGLGAALQTGYIFAKTMHYDFAVHFDADGQHIAKEVRKILQPVENGECDLAVGSRFRNENSNGCYAAPFPRRLASISISRALRLLIHHEIKDPTSGFRAMNRKVIALFCQYYPCDYPEVEELLILDRQGLKIGEFAVTMRMRLKGKSSLNLPRSLFYMFKVFLALFIDFFWARRIKFQ